LTGAEVIDAAMRRRIVGWGLAAHAVARVAPISVLAPAYPPADLAVTLAAYRLGVKEPAITLLGFQAPFELDRWGSPAILFDNPAKWAEFARAFTGDGLKLVLASSASAATAVAAFGGLASTVLLLRENDASGHFAVGHAGASTAALAEAVQRELDRTREIAQRFGVRDGDPAFASLAPRDHCVRAFLEVQVALQLDRLAAHALRVPD
jgi:hypothetical protein